MPDATDTELRRAAATLGELDWLCGFLDDRVAGREEEAVSKSVWGTLFTGLDAPEEAPGLAAAAGAVGMDDLLRALWTLDDHPDQGQALATAAHDAREHLDGWLDRRAPVDGRDALAALRRTRAEAYAKLRASGR